MEAPPTIPASNFVLLALAHSTIVNDDRAVAYIYISVLDNKGGFWAANYSTP